MRQNTTPHDLRLSVLLSALMLMGAGTANAKMQDKDDNPPRFQPLTFADSPVNAIRLTSGDAVAESTYAQHPVITHDADGNIVLTYDDGQHTETFAADGTVLVNIKRITDDEPFNLPYNTYKGASYSRTLSGNWGTLCLPFAFDPEDIDGAKFYRLSSVDEGTMHFDELTTTVPAYTPIIFNGTDGTTYTFRTADITFEDPSDMCGEPVDGFTMLGTVSRTVIDVAGQDANDYWFIGSDNLYHRATGTLTVAPYRSYFVSPRAAQASSARTYAIVIGSDGDTTAILDAQGTITDITDIYDLQGRRITELHEGLNIVRRADGSIQKLWNN